MNWFDRHNKKEFNFDVVIGKLLGNVLSKEMDFSKIKFDLENDDIYKENDYMDLDVSGKNRKYRVLYQIRSRLS